MFIVTNPWQHNVSANIQKPKEYEETKEQAGTGEEQPPRPDQTDISISGEDSVPSPVSTFT